MKKVTAKNYKKDTLYPRVARATHELLRDSGEVAPVEVFIRMGVLSREDLSSWRRGELPYLERVIKCNLSKICRTLRILGVIARHLNLGQRTVQYMPHGKKRRQRPLQFSKYGDPKIEAAYATHFVSRRSAENP